MTKKIVKKYRLKQEVKDTLKTIGSIILMILLIGITGYIELHVNF